MELKVGYKLTEVGIIPEDWDVKIIQSLALITTGSRNTQDKIEDGNYPFFVRSQTVEKINSYSYDGEAVLTAGDGVGVGKVVHYINGKFDIHQRVYKISDFDESLNGYFFYLYFKNNFLNRIMQMTAKSSVDSVRMDMNSKMPIPIPSTLIEQTAIATALSDADELISSLEKLIEKRKVIKQGLIQELLKPKKGWVTKKLGEICINIGSGKSNTKSQEGQYPIFGSTGIIGWSKSFDYFGQKILIARVGANAGTVNKVNGNYCVSDNTLMVSLKSEIDLNYIYNFLIQFNLNKLVFGSGQPLITGRQLKSIEVTLPNNKIEQTQIATILSDSDDEIDYLETKLAKCKQQKQGMMQSLLTGKIRIYKPITDEQ